MTDQIVDELLGSAEPSIRWMLRTRVLGEPPIPRSIGRLRDEIRRSPRVQTLLAGVRRTRPATYAKWQGAHWVLASLAELGHPPGDTSLEPECSEVLNTWLSASYFQEFVAESKDAAYRRTGVPVIEGRHRRCASQQGGALLSATRLGLVDQEQAGALVERLLHWQWPDGGWNCDKRPQAHTSSIFETVLPMRGLATHASATNDLRGAERGGPSRRGAPGTPADLPQIDRRADPPRLRPAALPAVLALRRARRPQGDGRHRTHHRPAMRGRPRPAGVEAIGRWRVACRAAPLAPVSADVALYNEHVEWGPVTTSRRNPWVTADALYVLRSAGRLPR